MTAYQKVLNRYITRIRQGTEAPTSESSDFPPKRRPAYLQYLEK